MTRVDHQVRVSELASTGPAASHPSCGFITGKKALSELLAELKRCSRSKDLLRGMQVHSQAISSGFFRNKYLVTSLINMYAKCGSMTDARKVFDSVQQHDVVSWTALILGFIENGKSEAALEAFHRMEAGAGEILLDSRVFVVALSACAILARNSRKKEGNFAGDSSRWLLKGKTIHAQAISNRCCDVYVENTLVNFYVQCGCMVEARSVFDGMNRRDTISWNALLQGYVENNESLLALELLDMMKNIEVRPDARTYVAGLTACASLAGKNSKQTEVDKWLRKGKELHSRAVRNRCSNIFVENTAIDMYAKCGSMEDSRLVFNSMARRDSVSWNALLQGYVENGASDAALEMYDRIEEDGVLPGERTFVAALSACANLASQTLGHADADDHQRSENPSSSSNRRRRWYEKGKQIHLRAIQSRCCDMFVENMLIHMYAQCGRMAEARQVFDKMIDRNIVTWNCLIQGYVDNGEFETCLELGLRVMELRKNSLTFMALLMACGSLMAVEDGKAVHAEICSVGLEQEIALANCLVDFYSKCGCMEDAKRVFDSIAQKSSVSWTALMCGYSLQGESERVFEVFGRMREEGFQPNEAALVCVLAVCSHSGETERGKEFFSAMRWEYGLDPTIKHYGCMVDLLGRATDDLDEAVKVVKGMPLEANAVTWRVLLSACRKWGDVRVGRLAYEALLALDERDASASVLMASVYRSGFGKQLR